MSHAWGQTVPSNYGRLPPSRQREFHTDAGTGEALELVIKQTMEELTEKVTAEVTQELQGKVQKEVTAELVAEAQEKTLRELGEDTSAEAIEKLYKKNLKEIAGESGAAAAKDIGAKATREGTEKSIKKTVDAVPESAIERLGKRAITVGGIGITGFAMFNSFLNSDALDDYVASTTGRDCDEKAEEASLEPGTQEYTDHVTECQEKAVENMAFLGKAMTYGGLGIGALIAVSILAKIGIFKKGSKSSDDEE